MTEDCIWSAGVAAVAGAGVGAVVEGGGAGSRHPLRQVPPRLVFLRAVAVPVRVVGVPVSHQQGVTSSWERRRVEVVGPLVILAWSNWRPVEVVNVQ